jgi:hypothetical protein
MGRRTMGTLLGGLIVLAGLLPAGAQTHAGSAADEALRTRVWPRRLSLRVRAERCDALTYQVSQQLMTRVKIESEIASRRLSLFAPECTLGELRDGLAALFAFRLEPYDSAESVHLYLRAAPARRPAPGARRPALGPTTVSASRVPKRPAPTLAESREPRAESRLPADPKLQEKLDLSAVEVDDESEALPVILECLADAASILVLSDYTTRTDACPGGRTTSQFVASLNGLTLGEALDRTARAFNYSWSRSGRWFLFRSR